MNTSFGGGAEDADDNRVKMPELLVQGQYDCGDEPEEDDFSNQGFDEQQMSSEESDGDPTALSCEHTKNSKMKKVKVRRRRQLNDS